MKYFGVLRRFVILPLIVLRLLIWWEQKRGKTPPEHLQNWQEDKVLIGHALTAVAYTTPWDNYLVASGVWNYDHNLVNGFKIGWVPIEEYNFFWLQSLLTGSWLQFLSRHINTDQEAANPNTYPLARVIVTGGLGIIWLQQFRDLIMYRERTRYLNLILSWALPPIMLQTAFGGDILWKYRKLVATSIITSTAYLGYIDSLAIGSGTWHIIPEKTIQWEVIDNLPFEELLFFFLTNVLLTFGVTLVQAKESETRLPAFLKARYQEFKRRWNK
ncbi:MAG: lycopene cyclase domain-containing protein [Phototrophicales bacterium]|nr:MAG: lycopene cyclase domain-containing protein [Phototrophicales bacterium]RMG75511.1 MAG: lycopene cyclase domain-containing protein [Chloroflexota bacterium]